MSVQAVFYGDASVRRIVRDGSIVAFAMKMSNGQWGVFDLKMEHSLTSERFRTPALAAVWFESEYSA